MTATAQRIERHYWFPVRGCISTVDRHEVPLSMLGPDSRELLIEPGRVEELGKAKRRHGAASYGSNTGVLEMVVADATMRGLELFDMPTLVSGDGFAVLAGIFADESKRYGQFWLHDGSTDYTEGEEFGATHYAGMSAPPDIQAPPIPYDGNGATGYSRYAYEESRRHIAAGSRNRVGIKNREYNGGFLSAATNWDRSYNLISGSGTKKLRRFPTGLIMPLREAVRADGDYPAIGAQGSWQWGDQYYEAWGFEWEDGTRSMHSIPRDPQGAGARLPTGLALVTVGKAADAGAVAPNNNYLYVPDLNIRIGPPGTTARLKYRTAKITKTQAAAGAVPDISTLALCAVIRDNTSTRYNDPNGNDGVLAADSLLRTDQIWQPRARYEWAFDERHACGYIRPCPYAIILAHTGITNAGDINRSADSSALHQSLMLVQLRQDSAGAMTLRLRYAVNGGAVVPTDASLALAAITLQEVVDWICSTIAGAAANEWRAQLVPGTSGLVLASNLAPSHIDSAGGTWTNASPTLNLTNATDIAEGMKVNDAKWPAGTYVKSKSGNVLTMSANSTAAQAVGADVEFYVDTGDDATFTDATAHSQFGNMRPFGNCIPVILAFKQSYLDTFPTEKRDFLVTAGGPTMKPNGAHIFHTSPGGRYSGESAAGILMGGAPLKSGCVVFYSNWIGWYVNRRSGSTGEDEHYRMEWVDQGHGCKSPYSIVSGNGWVGCWRDDGFWIFDGETAHIISNDHFAVTTLGGVGEFAYEAGLCNAAAAADTNDYYFHAHYRDGRLWLNYRVSAGVFATACYDASISIEASGCAQMLDQDGKPFGWSPRCSYSWRSFAAGCGGAIGSVRKSDGLHLYQADDKNDKTRCGLVQEFETTGAYTDGADPVQWTLHGPTDMPGGLKKSALSEALTFLYKNTVTSGATGVVGTIYRNQARSASSTISLPTTDGTDFFTRKIINAPLKSRSPGDVVELKLTGGALAAERIFEISGALVPMDVLDSVT
jgi:hypothetical protein